MKDFEYQAPTSLDEALALLSDAPDQTYLLAGGTDLIVQLREGMRHADLVVDAKRIPELMKLSNGDGLRIGASVPCYQVYENEAVGKEFAGLVDVTRIIGGWQIQSRASIGGNLCNASPAADTTPMLIAYNATLQIAGKQGVREIPVHEFFEGPGKTVLKKGELLVSITVPSQPPNSGAYYQRFIPRNEMDIAVVGVGSWLQLDDGGEAIKSARIGLGAVAPTPLFAQEASDWLVGKPANDESFTKAGELAREIAQPISDMRGPAEYRKHLVGVLTRRTLQGAAARARGAEPTNGRHV